MTDKLINHHGGLYNRLTCEIKLAPFSLGECEQYFISEKFFKKNAPLLNEFNRLFCAIFNNPEMMISLIRAIGAKHYGCTRSELAEAAGMTVGGTLTKALSALIASDFIIKYVPFGCSKKEEYYKLTDSFCSFYLRFVENKKELTDTLVTKILLGALGCVPAYDRYYVQAVRQYGISVGGYDRRSVKDVAKYYLKYQDEFEKVRSELSAYGTEYPVMKIMDMCLWQVAFENDSEES